MVWYDCYRTVLSGYMYMAGAGAGAELRDKGGVGAEKGEINNFGSATLA